MGVLKNSLTNQQIVLRACHVFGRDPYRSDTFLENPHASQIHASIRWDGNKWEIFDHSRNGTLLDGVSMGNGNRAALQPASKIRFGATDNTIWTVENLAPPCAMLLSLGDRTLTIELGRFNLIPNESFPKGSVYISESGQWVWENEEKIIQLNDGDTIQAGRNAWRFHCPQTLEPTLATGNRLGRNPDAPVFYFQVSLNEEHVSIKILNAAATIDLEERTHHYVLLTLARRRRDDAERGIDAASQGWIDMEQLSRMLGLDPSHLNIQIFRARGQLARALPDAILLPDIIERRRGEIRFGPLKFQIMRGSALEGTSSAADGVQDSLYQAVWSA